MDKDQKQIASSTETPRAPRDHTRYTKHNVRHSRCRLHVYLDILWPLRIVLQQRHTVSIHGIPFRPFRGSTFNSASFLIYCIWAVRTPGSHEVYVNRCG